MRLSQLAVLCAVHATLLATCMHLPKPMGVSRQAPSIGAANVVAELAKRNATEDVLQSNNQTDTGQITAGTSNSNEGQIAVSHDMQVNMTAGGSPFPVLLDIMSKMSWLVNTSITRTFDEGSLKCTPQEDGFGPEIDGDQCLYRSLPYEMSQIYPQPASRTYRGLDVHKGAKIEGSYAMGTAQVIGRAPTVVWWLVANIINIRLSSLENLLAGAAGAWNPLMIPASCRGGERFLPDVWNQVLTQIFFLAASRRTDAARGVLNIGPIPANDDRINSTSTQVWQQATNFNCAWILKVDGLSVSRASVERSTRHILAGIDTTRPFNYVDDELAATIASHFDPPADVNDRDLYTVECDAKLPSDDIAFIIEGERFPINTLDLRISGWGSNSGVCYSVFQPTGSTTQTWVLGWPFLYNVALAMRWYTDAPPRWYITSRPYYDQALANDTTSPISSGSSYAGTVSPSNVTVASSPTAAAVPSTSPSNAFDVFQAELAKVPSSNAVQGTTSPSPSVPAAGTATASVPTGTVQSAMSASTSSRPAAATSASSLAA